MASSRVVPLSDDILLMIFKLAREEDQVTFNNYLQRENALIGRHWDDWGEEFDCDYERWQFELADVLGAGNIDDSPPRSTLLKAMGVCKHWYSLLYQTPSMWTVLEISFREGAAALEHARTFLQRSGSCLVQITLLWDDPTWIVPVHKDEIASGGGLPPPSREEIMDGVYLGLVIQELYAHVHRWREFTLRTTSITHTYQALSLMSRPSIHRANRLEKLHLQFIHNPRHVTHHVNEPSLFPGSMPPIRDLLLFGISWAWPSSSMLSSNLVDLRIHYGGLMNEDGTNPRTGPEAKMLWQLLGALVNLRTLALEVDFESFDDADTIELPRLHSLTIKSGSMTSWAVEFLGHAQMPDLRILTLCVTTEDSDSVEGILDGVLIELTDSEDSENPLELDELHLFNFADPDSELLHRLYTQMPTLKTLTLGPGANAKFNLSLAMGLLPTPNGTGLPDLPLPGLQTLVVFDIPKQLVRRIVLERQSLAGPLEELYCRYRGGHEDEGVPDDWQHQVEKYYCIGRPKSARYTDVVAKQWSYSI
ncbi:hypothetical protein DFJ58DRAFT_25285 [Suillus subalutaceus]|uniref:uncharacterized protein n=1 Tax=Suillus subalutaceus TaxID=48586 RepID=UPI001B878AD1|nr:uncharacterized protein DFJ58DRAFT_25285 [Suillus subalutaceus]KAG1844636.1 hypothetical protein DFJ58DRAFT_25285 [Suillus subalutaceus]